MDFTTPKLIDYDSLPFAKKYEYNGELRPYDYEPVREFTTLTPTVIYQNEKTVRLDFKQNFAGFVSFTIKGTKGSEVVVKHAEVLNDDGSLYFDNLRSAKCQDKIRLSGGVDNFEPK